MDRNTRKNVILLLFVLLGNMLANLGIQIVNQALPSIMQEYHISANLVQWISTGYTLIMGAVACITAYLINRYNLKKLFLLSVGTMCGGCLLSALSPNFWILVLSRIIQAIGGGILIPIGQMYAIRLFPANQRGKAMSLISIVVSSSLAAGPVVSGLLVDYFGWRSIFWMMASLSAIVIIGGIVAVRDIGEKYIGNMDILSVCLFTLGFSGLMVASTLQENYGWVSKETLSAAIFGLAMLAWFVARQLRLQVPLLELRVFANIGYSISILMICLIYGFMNGIGLIMVMYVQNVLQNSASISGLITMPGALAVLVVSFWAGSMMDKRGVSYATTLGMIVLSISGWIMVTFGLSTSLIWIMIIYIFFRGGTTFIFGPYMAYSMNVLEDRYMADGTAISNALRQVAGALGSAVLVAITVQASHADGLPTMEGVHFYFIVQAITMSIALVVNYAIHKKIGKNA